MRVAAGGHPVQPVTDEWRARVREALAELHLDQLWLARRIGASGAAVSIVLNGKVSSSGYVVPISDALYIPRPPYRDMEEQRIALALQEIKERDPAWFERINQRIADALAKAEEKAKHEQPCPACDGAGKVLKKQEAGAE
jgi:predicted transcriptional regulator